MKDIDNSNLVDFLGKECKNLLHDKCCSVWKGYGFQVVCNCECHRKLVLEKDNIYHDNSNEITVIAELDTFGEFNK